MKYLITVGTTSFDPLVEYLDLNLDPSRVEVVFQIANGSYVPKNFNSFPFIDSILSKYDDFIVVTHAGAGTVFKLLETERKFIAIPNLSRKDHHQLELANFLKKYNYAEVCFNYAEVVDVIDSKKLMQTSYCSYEKEVFFKGVDISKLIKECM